jgi:glyoxylase-like metal-dependent hydrolase (beta-lactamase superfamily II)
MSELPALAQYKLASGGRIYRIPMQVFPTGFIGYSHLLLGVGVPTLIDTGSGFGGSTADLLAGMQAVADDYGEPIAITDIERIIITHGHVDHFGGLSDILQATGGAQVGVHPLDRRILTKHDERVIVATKDLTVFFARAGVPEAKFPNLLNMYGFSKQHVRPMPVHFTFEEGDEIDGMRFYHVPGHCSGQVAIRIEDMLLSADHILERTSPHLAAESITHWTGVGHYRDSLRKVRNLPDLKLSLGGHENPVDDVYGRIAYIETRIEHKLERVQAIIRDAGQPMMIYDISKALYPDKHGFDVLLALQEAGAYVEYLYEHGLLAIANLRDYERDHNPALMYTTL